MDTKIVERFRSVCIIDPSMMKLRMMIMMRRRRQRTIET
jgi:hypothetical protein